MKKKRQEWITQPLATARDIMNVMVNIITDKDNLIGSQQPIDDSRKGAQKNDSRPVVNGLLRVNGDLQLENGNYTRIVNRIIEELVKTPLLGAELAICLFIIRKTYGLIKKKMK